MAVFSEYAKYDAVGLAETVEVLESLMRRLDVAGLTGEEPTGALWSFQRSIAYALPLTHRVCRILAI